MTSMPRQRGVTEFQPKRALSNSNPNVMKDKPETLIQPTMGIKWNSGSLLDMEAHMPSATQNNSKRTKETTKKGGISLTIMGQRQTYKSIHTPQR